MTQRDEITNQRDEISRSNRSVTDSIRYAKRIQSSMLPDASLINQIFDDHFVFYIPKDIVSGDFYWMTQIKNEHVNKVIIAASDCTGHGVTGAFMSIMGINLLNTLVNEQGIYSPEIFLQSMRSIIISPLHQDNSVGQGRDGMEIFICCIDINNSKFEFAGAGTRMLFFNGDEKSVYTMNVLQGNRMPVDYHVYMEDFDLQVFEYSRGDIFYLFSDGYRDQQGGANRKCMGSHRFYDLINRNVSLAMKDQKTVLIDYFKSRREEGRSDGSMMEQIDDVMVLGLRL